MEASSFAVVKREADRTIVPAAIIMLVAVPAVATVAFIGMFRLWSSEAPDWAYDAVSTLTNPLIALVMLAIYAWGRARVKRRVLPNFGGDSGHEVLAQAARRGALRRYNAVMIVLALALYVACQFYVSYLSSKLDVGEGDDWDDQAQPSTTEAQATHALPCMMRTRRA